MTEQEKLRRLSNCLDSITSSRRKAEEALAEMDREFSRLRLLVPDLDLEHSLEWHERLSAYEHLITVGKASTSSMFHYISNVLSWIRKSLPSLNEV